MHRFGSLFSTYNAFKRAAVFKILAGFASG